MSLVTLACVVTTLLPFVPHPHGIFRAFEFPRLHTTVISATLLLLTIVFLPTHDFAWLLACALVATLLTQLWHIARFSPFWRRRSKEFRGDPEGTPLITMLINNVKQSNCDYKAVTELLREHDPDIAVFMETDQPWIDAIADAAQDYPHRIEHALDNGYGILLLSRHRLYDHQVRFLLNPEVPSIDTMVSLPDGEAFRLFAVHPEPPLIHADTMGRDAEIAFVGKMVRYDEMPVIVCGDLNDVAWSRTTRRFLRISRLLDPREGRGMFNTFDARYFFLRWPLDHIFHSPHFQLVSMQRMPFVGSDHFPMFYKVALTDSTVGRRRVDAAEKTDIEEADALIEVESNRDRRPVGHDWENQ
ncbi:MAG: endonuclease/exonuclease/phosphatase family protein [Pseudomonadota bacterium]